MTTAKPKRGRPPLAASGEAGKRYQVHLPQTIATKLRALGRGSLSLGIMIAAEKLK